jgi:acid phosphatase type 7
VLAIVKGPYLQWPTQNSMIIMWETSDEATSEVSYSQTERVHRGLDGRHRTLDETLEVVRSNTLCRIHRVTIQGLEPGTTYHYRVRSTGSHGETITSDEHPFKTAGGSDQPFSFAVTAETGGYGDDEINSLLFGQMVDKRPDFALFVGDVVENGDNYDEWDRYFFEPGNSLFHHTPFYLCMGNHEEQSKWYSEFVSFPDPKTYYSFDYGNAHFVALDSTSRGDYGDPARTQEPAMSLGEDQLKFLVDDLRCSQAEWKVVFFHYPPYVSGDFQVEQMRALSPILEEHGVDLVFNAHTLVYERSHPIRDNRFDLESGITYVVAGGGGVVPNRMLHKREWHTAQSFSVPHFVQVVIAGPSLELRAFDTEGHLFDTLLLTKNQG